MGDWCWVHHSFSSSGIQHGLQKLSAYPVLTKEGTVARNSQTVQEVSCQVGNLAKGWVNALWASYLSGTLRKGTKERCQQDEQISKAVNLAFDTQETQMYCLHKKTTPKWWWHATRHNSCPCWARHLQCCANLCAYGALRVTTFVGGLLCLSSCSRRGAASAFCCTGNDKEETDKSFPGVKVYATGGEGATEAWRNGKKTCTPKGMETGGLWCLTAGRLANGAGPRQQMRWTSSLRGTGLDTISESYQDKVSSGSEWLVTLFGYARQTHCLGGLVACLDPLFVVLH